jgi:hypothetical protein
MTMTDNKTEYSWMNEVNPEVEAEKQLWEALKTLGLADHDNGEFLRVCIATAKTGDREKMKSALEAMMHPSSFLERDFCL